MPVSPRNFFRLLAAKETALLFPGGVLESNHRKGEDYRLFWPERPDFVRLAAKFDAVIVPFGAIGAADSVQLVADPSELKELSERVPAGLRDRLARAAGGGGDDDGTGEGGEERGFASVPSARQGGATRPDVLPGGEPEDFSFPLGVPSPSGPDRFYFLFGEPFDTRDVNPKDKDAVAEAYAEVRGRVQGSIDFLLTARERDPFRALAPRLLYERLREQQAPTFPLNQDDGLEG